MRFVRAIGIIALVCLFQMQTGAAFADTAQVLPRGVSNVSVINYNYFDIDERYDPDGHSENIAVDYNRELDSSVFTDLAGLDAFVADGTATLGESVVDFTLQYDWWEIVYAYGLSDNLTLALLIPYNNTKNRVNASLDTTNADVGLNPAYTLAGFDPGNPATYPIVPVASGGVPLDTNDIFALLGPGLDVDGDGQVLGPEPAGFGYDPVETWSDSGIGDVELIGKYKLSESDNWRLAVVGGLRLPTGEVDDPDNLVDVPMGDGQMDVILRFHADYKGFDKLFLNGTVRYDLQLPDEETKRVPDDVNLPLTSNKEKVDRDLGDLLELELLGSYSLTREWSVGLKYRYSAKFKDDISGNQGFEYSSLEDESDFTSHMAFLTVGYSTVQKYLDKETKVPFNVGLTYRDRFAGTNNVTNSQYLSLELGLFF